MDRREFLRLMLLGTSSAAVPLLLPGCRGGPAEAPKGSVPAPFSALAPKVAETAEPGLNVFLGGGEYLAGATQRISVGLVKPDGLPLEDGRARAWLGQGRLVQGAFPMTYRAFSTAHTHSGEHLEPHGFYDVIVTLPTAGVVDLMIEVSGDQTPFYGFAALQVKERGAVPAPGQEAIPVSTPTVEDPRGVAAVCTREPPCDMHAVGLDEALRSGKPVVFTVATPRLCTSRICGPVVDEVITVFNELKDRATFVHAEVFRDLSGREPAPAFIAWRLESEPWVFVIDAAGRVHERYEGPVVAPEVRQALLSVV